MDEKMHLILWHTEIIVRFGIFFSVLGVMALWEWFAPWRHLIVSKPRRWLSNLSMGFLNIVLVRVFFPTAAIGMSIYAQQHRIGLFHVRPVHAWMAVMASVIFLDLVIYLQHRVFHATPLFWRFHRVHHVDLDLDVTTGIRFHPIEIVLSLLIKYGAILLIGASAVAVLTFEVLLSGITLFNHSNIRIPLGLDNIIRLLIVTPHMHRVHHSDIPRETNSNFGFNLSVWDRLFDTYRYQPRRGYADMVIGLNTIRDPAYSVNLNKMLRLPFERLA